MSKEGTSNPLDIYLYRKTPLIRPGRIQGQMTNLMSLY